MKATKIISKEIPAAFLARMAGLLGVEYPAFLSSLKLPAVTGLRVNTIKMPLAEFQTRSPWDLSPLPWCPSGFMVNDIDPSESQPGKHPYHAAGLYYLQEPSAMAAAEILAPLPGEKVLDLAAAPGGKATHLTALMNNTGLLVTNEISLGRFRDLFENLQRCGVTNSIGTHESPQALADHFGAYFDRVLLDAPCSGEGMFRKSESARRDWSPEHVHSCAIRQAGILEQAGRMVKPGGHLVYSTCTFSPDENEGVITRFLAQHPEFDLEAIRNVPGFSPARPEWVGLPPDDRARRAIRIWPHLAEGEGHFIALLFRQDARSEGKLPVQPPRLSRKNSSITKLDAATQAIFENFCKDHLNLTFDRSRLGQVEPSLYYLPEPYTDLSGLPVIHPGWFLGHIQKGRFIPSHFLAMGIERSLAPHTLNLAPDDARLSAYMAGSPIPNAGENAWVLVTVDGYPVGWGKRVQNIVKNYFPHALRKRT